MVQADINIIIQVYLPTPLYYIWDLTNQSKYIEGISDNLCDGPGRHKHNNSSLPTYTTVLYIWDLTNQSKYIEGISDNLCDGPGRHKHNNHCIPTYTTVLYMGLDQSKQIHRRNI